MQSRFFNLLDQNVILKETIEKLKQEFIILNVEINQYKKLGLRRDVNDVSTYMFSTAFQKLKLKLESCEKENENLKNKLNLKGEGKINEVPK